MASGDLLKQLFRNYTNHDTPGFEAVAQQIIAEERQKNHHLRRAICNEVVCRD